MHYEIKFGPAFSLLSMDLEQGEMVVCESGAMVSMSATLDLEARMNGDQGSSFFGRALSAASRATLGGETFFITSVTATDGPGHLALAPAVPGDIAAVDVGSRPLVIQSGSYLACSPGLTVQTGWGGLKSLLGGEGLFFLRTAGSGTVFLASFGAIYSRTLTPGEQYVVDSGHMVAFEDGMTMQTRFASRPGRGGLFSRMVSGATTGEGLVMEFTGPGTVWMQTRNPDAFSSWIQSLMPQKSSE